MRKQVTIHNSEENTTQGFRWQYTEYKSIRIRMTTQFSRSLARIRPNYTGISANAEFILSVRPL